MDRAIKVKKKPIVVEALRYHPDDKINSVRRMKKVWGQNFEYSISVSFEPETKFVIFTPEGPLEVSPGDWVIKGIKGEFYPIKPDIFQESYQIAEPTPGADYKQADLN